MSSNSSGFSDKFTHLHLHTVYSLLDGAIRIKDLMKHVKASGMDSVAITDHGNMFGAVEFYDAAIKEGIKPIIGSEFYVAPGSRHEKSKIDGVSDGNAYHMVLLAKNLTGYKNLMKLSSRSYTEGFYRKPRIDYELLAENAEGLIGTTACLAGEVNRKLVQNRNDEAKELALHLNEVFGKGNFFLEIQNHGIKEQAIAAKGAYELHKQTQIPLVLTNDAHFLNKEDQKAQDIMLRIQMNKKIDEPLAFGFNEEFYVKPAQEMSLLFPELPDAFNNTTRISEMVDLELAFGTPLLPHFDTPDNTSLPVYLKTLVSKGLNKFFPQGIPREYEDRAKYELDVIGKMGYDGYFLIVADFIQHAKKTGIPVGPGRGSAAGSLVAYSLGITAIDPLKYDLLFERFLNPSRNEMPDIDIDFCRDRREDIINYVIDKYGEDHVSQIITFGTLSAKAVIKDVARVMGFDFAEINAVSKNMPDTPGITLDEVVANSPETKNFFKSGEKEQLLWKVAKTLEGIPRNSGKHAAGVVISPEPMENIIPIAKDTKTGTVISQFEKNNLEKVGLVKMDFLGLKNLTIIQKTLDELKVRQNLTLDIEKIPLDDPKPYNLIQSGKTKGIFQLENTGMTRLLMRSRPDCFEDIIACIALYRPGPLESGMTEEYVLRKNGEKKVTYPHESLSEVLKDTFGTMVYQEQVMIISQIIAGFTMAEADTLRKAMGKKKMDVMAEIKKKFVDQSIDRGHQKKWAGELFDNMAEFGKYGFNKSHSAAYGLITYQTAYLKVNYTIEFMKATLDSDIENTEKLIGFIHESRELGINILPPDVNESSDYFTILDEKIIRYGLLGLKGIGKTAVDAIVNAKREGPFKDIIDFSTRVDYRQLNKKVLEALVYCGAFDSMGYTRSSLLASVEEILSYGQSVQQDKENGQSNLFGADQTAEGMVFRLPDIDEWDSQKKLILEKSTLGLYLTSHPLDKYLEALSHSKIINLSDADDGISSERYLTFMGVIESVKNITTKRGRTFQSISLSDLSGRAEIRVFERKNGPSNLYSNGQSSGYNRGQNNGQFNGQKNDFNDQDNSALLEENSIIIIDAKVTVYRDSDTPTVMIVANKIKPGKSLIDNIDKSLHLYFPQTDVFQLKNKIHAIKNTLQSFKGDNPVYLHYRNTDKSIHVVKAHSTFSVKYCTEVIDGLKSVMESEKHIAWRVADKVEIAEETHIPA